VEATGIGPRSHTPPHHDLAAVASEGDPSFVPAGLESRGQNFVDLPTPEVSATAAIGTTSAQDEAVTVWGEADNELVMITQENRILFAQTSSDGGATFAPAVRFAGPPSEPPISSYRFVATFNALYVAYTLGDPGGDVGLSFRRSFDMGRTWSAPVVLIARGNPHHGLSAIAISANGAGRVAIMFGEEWEGQDAWVVASSNQGDTWTTPVRLDSLNAPGAFPSQAGDIEVSSTGTIHATFMNKNRVYYTRSSDGGFTFVPEVNFTALSPNSHSDAPDLVTFPNGHVVLAYWNDVNGGTDFIDVFRSTNDGASFTLTAHKPFPTQGTAPSLHLLAATNFPDVVVAWTTLAGVLRASLSQDTGATFGADTIVSNDADAFDIARTAANQWVLAWSDKQWMPGAFASVSTNGGVTWGAPQRADQGPGATAESRFGGVTIAGTDTVFFAYRDRRDDQGKQWNVYAADATPGTFDFTGHERRVDTDAGGSTLLTHLANFATDGTRGYFAMSALTNGAGSEMWVTRTLDGGRTFQPAVKISSHDPGDSDDDYPIAKATPDGSVYVTWRRWFPALGSYALYFARSTDFGVTWGPQTLIAGGIVDLETHEIAATASAVVVLWSDGQNIRVVRSVDHGASFSPASVVDDNPTGTSRLPTACTQNSRIWFAYEGFTPGFGTRPLSRRSADDGATWGPLQSISQLIGGSAGADVSIACSATSRTVAVWIEGSLPYAAYSDGGSWISASLLDASGNAWDTDVTWAGQSSFVVSFGSLNASVVSTTRTLSGGVVWDPPVRHGTAAPQPLALRLEPHVAGDSSGKVWVSWWDMSAGQPSIALRYSDTSGTTWGPVRRADRGQPQGANWNFSGYILSAQPGIGIVAWGGQRQSSAARDILFNSWNAVDLDADGSADASDCDDESAAVYPGAPEACDGSRTIAMRRVGPPSPRTKPTRTAMDCGAARTTVPMRRTRRRPISTATRSATRATPTSTATAPPTRWTALRWTPASDRGRRRSSRSRSTSRPHRRSRSRGAGCPVPRPTTWCAAP
jgi:hypothetical protein